jgi:dihydrofolate synthase/folylpolyglutamate synthase
MTYTQALAFWFAHINYEQRTPTSADLGLERMRALLARLGNPHHRLRVLHVAGSKGKGSVSAMLAAVLQRAGYRTGLFTSPHLCRIEERFQVNGEPILPEELAAHLTDLHAVVETMRPAPTFFELATAAGFLHFERRRVDAAVLEVGLGGRLDSTNVCRPTLSVITSISLDHTRILGDKLAMIAREKAGIVKRGVPVVSGVTGTEARTVIERICRERSAPLRELERDFHYRYRPGHVTQDGITRPRVDVDCRVPGSLWGETDHRTGLELALLGEHQAANAAVVLACVEELLSREWRIPPEAVAVGLREVQWPGRLEVMRFRPLVVLDCAHNLASASAVVETLRSSFVTPPGGQRRLIFAGSSDKDLAGMLRVLGPAFHHVYLTRYTNNPRAVSPEQLAGALEAGGVPFTLCATPAEAWRRTRAVAGTEDLICITGSVFLAGEMRPMVLE